MSNHPSKPSEPPIMRHLIVSIGHDVTETDSLRFDAPIDATQDEILRLAEQAVRDYVENDGNAWAESDLGDSNSLRINGIYKDDLRLYGKNEAVIAGPVPLEPNNYEIGYAVSEAAKLLEKGAYTENQFILETLYAVYRNNPDPENGLLSKAFIASYEEVSREETLRKMEVLADMHQGVVSEETGPIALTMKNAYGEMSNVVAQPPSVIGDGGRIFSAFRRRDDGRTALVSRTENEIKAFWDNGEMTTAEDIHAFGHDTRLIKVPSHEYDAALGIIENLRHLIPADESPRALPNEEADAVRASGRAARMSGNDETG